MENYLKYKNNNTTRDVNKNAYRASSSNLTKLKEDFLKINFGDIDGRSDPNLTEYFIDRDYWNRIVNGYKFFVIGRKGTGKSALYNWFSSVSKRTGNICHNILFNDFPMGQLLNLSDDSFIKPNQYQTICKNMILSEICKMILEDDKAIQNECYKLLKEEFLNPGLDDCFRKSVTITKKSKGQLNLLNEKIGFSSGIEQKDCFDFSDKNLQYINSILENTIINYCKGYHYNNRFIIQIDGIDENYTQIISMDNQLDDYFGFVISLLKTVYSINQKFHLECSDLIKSIVYVRSDIMEKIHKIDAESARWEQQTEFLDWSIGKESNWYKNDLRNLINRRIQVSLPELKEKDCFDYIFNNYVFHIKQGRKYFNNLFEYMGIRSFYRPRDIIQFCISIQNNVRKYEALNANVFYDGEKEYSLWFLAEITNEISPVIKDTDTLFSLLRTLGSKAFSITLFRKNYSKYIDKLGLDADVLLRYLYDLGVIYNIDDNNRIFTSIRNFKSKLNPDMRIALHAGFWKGLYTSTFYGK